MNTTNDHTTVIAAEPGWKVTSAHRDGYDTHRVIAWQLHSDDDGFGPPRFLALGQHGTLSASTLDDGLMVWHQSELDGGFALPVAVRAWLASRGFDIAT